MKYIFITFILLLSSPTLAGYIENDHCFRENIAAKKISELPPHIKTSLLDMFNEKIGDYNDVTWGHALDYPKLGLSEKQYQELPRVKFDAAYYFKEYYVVFVQYPDQTSRTSFVYGNEPNKGMGTGPYPWFHFHGPVCSVLTAIQNGVRNPNNFPKYVIDGLTDKK